MRAAVRRRAPRTPPTACAVPNRRAEGRMKRALSAEPQKRSVSFHWELSQKRCSIVAQKPSPCNRYGEEFSRTRLTPALRCQLSKKALSMRWTSVYFGIRRSRANAGSRYVQAGITGSRCAEEYRAVSTNYNLFAALASRADNLCHGVAA
jgi:hypothetical protein